MTWMPAGGWWALLTLPSAGSSQGAATDLRRVDLNLLVVLGALLAERNVTRAGQRLSLSQPAMSAALARLRRLLGDQLLVRSGRQLLLTPYAETLVSPVNDILASIERALTERPGFDPAADARTFTVAASDYATLVLLRPLLARVQAAAPGVRLRIQPMTGRFADQLSRDEIDLLVIPREAARPPAGTYPSQQLFSDQFVIAAAADHPEIRHAVTARQLATLPYVAYRAGNLPSLPDANLVALGILPQVEVSTESWAVHPWLLKGTRMISVLPERLARMAATAAGIRILQPPVPLGLINEAMYWHPRRTQDPAHTWLRTQLADLAATLPPLS